MSKLQGVVCQHLIGDVALRKVDGRYLVECHGCASPLGVVADPREFQALRRTHFTPASTLYKDSQYRANA